jgi:HK97 family phage major capsid protein
MSKTSQNRFIWSLFAIVAIFLMQHLGYAAMPDDITTTGAIMLAGMGEINVVGLREKRNALASDIRALLEDSEKNNKAWAATDQEKYDAKMAEIDAIDSEVKRIQAYLDKVNDEHINNGIQEHFNNNPSKDQQAAKSRDLFAKWLRGGDKAMTAQDWQEIRNTMSTGTGNQGGFTVQSDIASTLVESLKAFGGIRSVATVINTDMGNPLSFPTSDGTAETGELIAENTTATDADPTFGTVAVNAFKFSSKVVAVPIELLQDSQIDVEAFVNSRLISRIGRITNTLFTTGTGTGQPRGVAVGAASGKVGTSGQTTSVIFDDLVDLVHSVDPAYRAGRCGFMMNDASLRNIRKLKDSQNRPVFIPGWDGLAGPMGDTLLGYPVTINQDVAVMAANARSILFGDFSKYIVRDVMGAELFRFDDSAYVKLGQIGFLMWARSGGNLTDTAAVKFYQNSAS